jgi:hypothetical protein
MSLSNKITIIERLLGVVSEENTKKSFSKIRRRISFEYSVITYIKKYVNSCGRLRHKSPKWHKKCVINGLVMDFWHDNMHNFEGVDIDEFYDLLEEFLIEKYGDEVEDEIKKFRDDKSIVTESTYLRRRFMPEDIEDQFNEALNYASFKFYDKKSSFYNSDPKAFRRIVINILMDHLHPRLSDWGTQDFPYEEVYEYLTEYYSQRILERYKELNENCYDENEEIIETELTERCWKGYTQKGMKTMFGKRYPNCVKKTKK